MEYERLTRKADNGTPYFDGCLCCDLESDCGLCPYWESGIKRLAELEDKIEQGTLLELACKKGDKVYQVDCVRVYELTVLGIRVFNNKFYYETQGVGFDNTAIGESIFLTREEAENKLKELQK